MNIDIARKVFKSTEEQRKKVVKEYEVGSRYYHNENDITKQNQGESKADGQKEDANDPLHKHDSRISANYHQLLVDQKASYAGSVPPTIDVDEKEINSKVKNALGDRYQAVIQHLIVDASLAGIAWLHVWIDDDKQFRYGLVKPDQVVPIYSDTVEKKLLAVRRTYDKLDPEDGKTYTYDEYWTETEGTFFKRESGKSYDELIADNRISTVDVNTGENVEVSNVIEHGMGDVPFIQFANNADELGDLNQYKGQIDAYDIALNGFVNDVQDVQQVLMVLKNYGGTDLDEFMENLKKYKSVKFEDDDSSNSGMETVTVDIPVEARNSLMNKLNDDIYTFGQGLDPNKVQLGTAMSGVALKMMHSALEMKSAKVESEFRAGINRLIRFILRFLSADDKMSIKQTWTRSLIQNDLERAQVVATVASFTSNESLAQSNPIVDDWEEELKNRAKETQGTDSFENDDALNEVATKKAADEE